MALVYSASDLVVLPSFQDNFPNIALEALSCGVPTVAFGVEGIPEIAEGWCHGAQVAPEIRKRWRKLSKGYEHRSARLRFRRTAGE